MSTRFCARALLCALAWTSPDIAVSAPAPPPGPTTAKPPATSAKPPATSAKPPATSAKPPATSAKPPATSAKPPATSAKPPATSAKPGMGGTGGTGGTGGQGGSPPSQGGSPSPQGGSPPPQGGSPPPQGGTGGTGTAGGTGQGGVPTANTPTSISSHAAPMLGTVGTTTATGTDTYSARSHKIGETIAGPFEAGFSSAQADILKGLGCTDVTPTVDGGIDTLLAEQLVAYACGVTLPRVENSKFIGIVDACGGHTEYHFHQRFTCLYNVNATGHSTQVGKTNGGQLLYGKYEATNTLPLLDACGGHIGTTPDSKTTKVYHYHVQDNAPFTFGCYGPNDAGGLVTVAQCRSYYSGCDGNLTSYTTKTGTIAYDNWCPCYDANGSNSGKNIKELAVFSSADAQSTVVVTASTTKKLLRRLGGSADLLI